jgi:hypothetical protein
MSDVYSYDYASKQVPIGRRRVYVFLYFVFIKSIFFYSCSLESLRFVSLPHAHALPPRRPSVESSEESAVSDRVVSPCGLANPKSRWQHPFERPGTHASSRDTPATRALRACPLCPSRRGLEGRRAGAATRRTREPLSTVPTTARARAAARRSRLLRLFTFGCLGAHLPPRPRARTPRSRPLSRRTTRRPHPRPRLVPRTRSRSWPRLP